jgi:hypothetical protein
MNKAGTSRYFLLPLDVAQLHARIKEVYRLCFGLSNGKDVTVLSDFAAHYPELALNCEWLANPIKSSFDLSIKYPALKSDRDARRRILGALANGFRRAARPRLRHKLVAANLAAARLALKKTKEVLREFRDRDVPRRPWLKEQKQQIKCAIREMVNELAPCDAGHDPIRSKLEALLLQRRFSQAAVKITAKLFHVRERALETKTHH